MTFQEILNSITSELSKLTIDEFSLNPQFRLPKEITNEEGLQQYICDNYEQVIYEFQIRLIDKEKEALEHKKWPIEKEIDAIKKQSLKINEGIAPLRDKINSFKNTLEEIQKKISLIEADLKTLQETNLKIITEEKENEFKLELTKLKERESTLKDNIALIKGNLSESKNEISKNNERTTKLYAEISIINEQISEKVEAENQIKQKEDFFRIELETMHILSNVILGKSIPWSIGYSQKHPIEFREMGKLEWIQIRDEFLLKTLSH